MSSKDDIRRLIIEYQRRLQKLNERKAKFGIDTPPATLTEIEDIEAELERLQIKLSTIEEAGDSQDAHDIGSEILEETALRQKPQSVSETYTGGDVITIGDIGAGAVVAAGRQAEARVQSTSQSSDFIASLIKWQAEIETKIEALPGLSSTDKQEIKEQIGKIKTEAVKGDKVNQNRLEKLINVVGVMGPDIFEVVVATLKNPLAGIGLVLEKIGDRVKLQSKSKNL